ncbi:GCN5 family acetyltransferase [Rhizobium sp. R72]|uniref:GNAT family N-acetyltransferase n=1 Tax=unclassified Rhizobium TaxID=2613769 RepID=UPI000B529B01|nr:MULTISPECIES: GNAT family N-acetyltransferase [unclassified Rhizobium]OWV92780.1 GCN5 family acetyltransferase [Rhizobium sp. R72]OWV92991.1 GCN5 family acetyltransferase [Rhizobium sp. R711]
MVLTLREAVRGDAATLLAFIRELAIYEKAEHQVAATIEAIEETIFCANAVPRAIICEQDGKPVGMAIWFFSYSTWQAKSGLYLEDLYVTPAARGSGAGKAMLKRLAQIALENGCGRFEWSVLDWNEPAIRVYETIGAAPMNEWIRYRLCGDTLKSFAAG